MSLNREISRRAALGCLASFLPLLFDWVAPGAMTPSWLTAMRPNDLQESRPATDPDTVGVLVELFTSEGCSTCPPADNLLTNLDETQSIKGVRVIALSEHVDYWNHLGWKDPFSTAEFSRRQAEYARALGTGDSYTPQMIVDGRIGFVGSNAEKAREAIGGSARSPKAAINLTIKVSAPSSVVVILKVENIPAVSRGDRADVMLAFTESGLSNNVVRGENSGRKLAHSAVTRKLVRIGVVGGETFTVERSVDLDSRWKRQNMKAVAFVQERSTRRVLGAVATGLTDR